MFTARACGLDVHALSVVAARRRRTDGSETRARRGGAPITARYFGLVAAAARPTVRVAYGCRPDRVRRWARAIDAAGIGPLVAAPSKSCIRPAGDRVKDRRPRCGASGPVAAVWATSPR